MIEYITLSDLVKKVSQDAVEKGKEIFNTKKIREKYINIFEMMNIDRDKLKASDCKQSKDFKIPKDSQKFLIEVYWLYSDADMKKMRKGLFEQASLESMAYNNAIKNGATSVLEPELEPWGQRTCYIADPEGNLIEIGSWNKVYEQKDL